MTAVNVLNVEWKADQHFHIFIEFIKWIGANARSARQLLLFFILDHVVTAYVSHESIIEYVNFANNSQTLYLMLDNNNNNDKIQHTRESERERVRHGFAYNPFIMVDIICIKPSNLSVRLSIFRSKQLNHATYVCSFTLFLFYELFKGKFMHSALCTVDTLTIEHNFYSFFFK